MPRFPTRCNPHRGRGLDPPNPAASSKVRLLMNRSAGPTKRRARSRSRSFFGWVNIRSPAASLRALSARRVTAPKPRPALLAAMAGTARSLRSAKTSPGKIPASRRPTRTPWCSSPIRTRAPSSPGSRRKPGSSFSLPTEAQWEYAARAGGTTAFPHGREGRQRPATGTQPVSEGPLNAWTLGDLAGNVWQWCALTLPRSALRVDEASAGSRHSGRPTQQRVHPFGPLFS